MNENENQLPPIDPVQPAPVTNSVLTPTADDRMWALFAHLSTFTAFISGIGLIVGPLVIWLIKRDSMPFVADQAKEALNFNITVALVALALLIFSFITIGIGLLITIPVGFALFLAWVVFTIIAAINANNGVNYRYPFTLRLVQ